MQCINRLTALALFCCTFQVNAETTTELKLGSFLPEQSQTHSIVFAELAKKIEEESEGTIKTSLHAGTKYSVEPVLNGELDITFMPPDLVTQYFPDSEVIEIPGFFPTDVKKASQIHQNLYDSGMMTHDPKLMALAAGSGGYLTLHVGFPFNGVDSLKGKKGGYSSASQEGALLDALGVMPVEVALGKHRERLEAGDIDLAAQNWAGASYLWNLLPAVEEHVHINLGHIPAMLVMNSDKYNSLNTKQREAIDASTGQWLVPIFHDAMAGGHFRALGLVEKNGAPITEVSPEDQKVVDTLYDSALERWISNNSRAGKIVKAVEGQL